MATSTALLPLAKNLQRTLLASLSLKANVLLG